MNEESIFMEALQKQTPEERAAFLDQACVDDADLRHSVSLLLRAHEKAGHFLQGVPRPGPTLDVPVPSERPGTIIGPYKLLQQIGEGGMGVVFMAEQTQPVQRKVALKVIKPGMDSRQIFARFEAERQALAMMDHVNIARVLDAGTIGGEPGGVSTGRPYFVMELVNGIPITKYCDDHHLTPRARLELFVPVCQAIQHAHQKGIIHRDIKPSNVMVTLYDGKPVPKVIDFGVAKATEQKLTEQTLFTQHGTAVGTLEYMSPEQAEASALGVDTRSDIYSLGVLLYELLTGNTPLNRQRLKEEAFGEILRIIKEEEPQKPSTRLSDSGKALASISAQRNTEPAKLTKLMRGELDWIVMRTLEKDRNRRYESASAFAADVQRYLSDEPVQACPPSARYRLLKFTRRNKAFLTAAALVVTTLILGTAASSWQAIRATHAEVQADSQRKLADQSADEARRQTDEAVWQRDESNRQELLVRAREASLRRYLYAADMKLAWQALNNANIKQVRRKLSNYEPDSKQEDLRSFVWYYLKRLCGQSARSTLVGHNGALYHLAISPDGKTLATASKDGTAKLWDLASGELRHTLRGHGDEVNCIAFAPDGKTLATASDDRTVQFWDPLSGIKRSAPKLAEFRMPVHRVEFSSDGDLLVTGELSDRLDVAAALWNFPSGRLQKRLEGNFPLALSPDSKTLATTNSDNMVILWDVAGGQKRTFRHGHACNVQAGVFSPNGQWLATCSEDVKLWDVLNSQETAAFGGHFGPVRSVAFSPDGKLMASGDGDGAIRVWECSGRGLRAIFSESSGRVCCVKFSPDGATLASTGDDDRTVKLWDVNGTHHAKSPPDQPAPVTSISFSRDNQLLATSIGVHNSMLWNVRTGEPQAMAGDDRNRDDFCVAFSPAGLRLATATSDQAVYLVDPITGGNRLAIASPGLSKATLTFSPDGGLLVGNCTDGVVRVWDTRTGKELHALKLPWHSVGAQSIAFSPDGKTLALTVQDDVVKRWDLATGQFRDLRTGHRSHVSCLAYSFDGQTLATGSSEQVKLWDVSTDQETASLSGHTGAVRSLAFSPDGRTLASACDIGEVTLWDLSTMQELANLVGHTGPVTCASFSPDGKTLVTAGASADGKRGEIRVWRTVETKREVSGTNEQRSN